MILPRGIRLNNPGNIDRSPIVWQGESTLQDDPRFIRFEAASDGIRALMKILLTYTEKYKLGTVRGLINRWAPPNENDTSSYIDAVAKHLEVDYDTTISVKQYLIPLAQAIIFHENGQPFENYPKYWYDDTIYQEAYKSALN